MPQDLRRSTLVAYRPRNVPLQRMDVMDSMDGSGPSIESMPSMKSISAGARETSDFDAVAGRAAETGRLARPPAAFCHPPYAGRRAALLHGPAGSRFEIVEAAAGVG